MTKTKKSLSLSTLALFLCVAMLIGTTFAWFTDTVQSGKNKIKAGNLDVDFVMDKTGNGTYTSIAGVEAAIFGNENSLVAQNDSTNTLWEPGKTQIAYLGVQNKGNLALKYNILVDVEDKGLVGALEYAIIDGAKATDLSAATKWSDITSKAGVQTGDVVAGITTAAEGGVLDEITKGTTDETDYFALAVHMKEDAGNDYKNKGIAIDVTVSAIQATAEYDSFGNDYDNIVVATEEPGIETIFEKMTEKYEQGGTSGTELPQEIIVQTPVDLKPVEVKKGSDTEPHNYAAEIDGATTTINLQSVLTATGNDRYDINAAMRIQGQSGRQSVVTFKGTENGKFTNVGSGLHSLIYLEGKSIVNFESGTFETTNRIITANLMSNPINTQQINVSGGTFIFNGKDKSHQATFTNNFIYGPFNGSITVTGGIFYNCDPSSKVASGYHVVSSESGNDKIYTVVAD